MVPRAVSLLSGGLDSVVATALARTTSEVVLALTVDYGQRAAAREIAAARRFCDHWRIPHRTIALPWLGEITTCSLVNRRDDLPYYAAADLNNAARQHESAKAVWVPNRNGVLLNVAAAIAESIGADAVIAGFNREEAETFPDNSEAFVERSTAALALSTANQVRVVSGTLTMTKPEIARTGRRLDVPLEWCWPCYEGDETWCGRCESCARFQRALQET